MRALETHYDGCYFRSRLEARWAVYLNASDIPWHYEYQGYDLDGIRYLPDFYLPSFECFLEVKGTRCISDLDWQKMNRLRDQVAPLFLAAGPIGSQPMTVFAHSQTDSAAGTYDGIGWIDRSGPCVFDDSNRAFCTYDWEPWDVYAVTYNHGKEIISQSGESISIARSSRFGT